VGARRPVAYGRPRLANGPVTVGRLLSLADPEAWRRALGPLRHGPAHTHWYNAALAESVDGEIALFEYGDGDDRAVCPIVLRRHRQSMDIATPYGFSGFATRGDCGELPDAFRRFATDREWVCGYITLHPLFPHPFRDSDGLEQGRTVYVLDLAGGEARWLASMHETHRYEIRKDAKLLSSIVSDVDPIARALPQLYAQTLARVGASDVYRFSAATLNAWLSSPDCLTFGLGDPLQAVILCLYTPHVADYFINASTEEGRRYTRVLLWAALLELERRGVPYFNLGGGAREGDALHAFKQRFGGRAMSVPVLKQIYRREEFARLCPPRNPAEHATVYFPPYRSP